MKLGIDFHGVITDNPDKFKEMCEFILAAGGEVHIMTGSRSCTFSKELVNMGFYFPHSHFFSVSDYMLDNGYECDLTDPDSPRFKDEHVWDTAKAVYAAEHDLTMVIDDSARYGETFTTPFLLYKTDRNQDLFKESVIGNIVSRTR